MVFKSFKEMGKAVGIKEREEKRSEKARFCKKCGSKMRHIAGTNVYICDGAKENGDPCGNIATPVPFALKTA